MEYFKVFHKQIDTYCSEINMYYSEYIYPYVYPLYPYVYSYMKSFSSKEITFVNFYFIMILHFLVFFGFVIKIRNNNKLNNDIKNNMKHKNMINKLKYSNMKNKLGKIYIKLDLMDSQLMDDFDHESNVWIDKTIKSLLLNY